ncbi:hypothetical protein V495_01675 [Pseudogymnoascus sp. VKM F-4514 (FW-929)]|nr:hypothetical protein V495_01675 [Pseudogymnoascus sp. VKM F-4514 (FW-929)]
MLCGEELRMPGYGAGKAHSAGLRHKAWATCEKGVGHVVCRLACVGYNRPSDGGRLCGDYDGSSGSAMPRLPQTTEAAASLSIAGYLHLLIEKTASCSAWLGVCTRSAGATAGHRGSIVRRAVGRTRSVSKLRHQRLSDLVALRSRRLSTVLRQNRLPAH